MNARSEKWHADHDTVMNDTCSYKRSSIEASTRLHIAFEFPHFEANCVK